MTVTLLHKFPNPDLGNGEVVPVLARMEILLVVGLGFAMSAIVVLMVVAAKQRPPKL